MVICPKNSMNPTVKRLLNLNWRRHFNRTVCRWSENRHVSMLILLGSPAMKVHWSLQLCNIGSPPLFSALPFQSVDLWTGFIGLSFRMYCTYACTNVRSWPFILLYLSLLERFIKYPIRFEVKIFKGFYICSWIIFYFFTWKGGILVFVCKVKK